MVRGLGVKKTQAFPSDYYVAVNILLQNGVSLCVYEKLTVVKTSHNWSNPCLVMQQSILKTISIFGSVPLFPFHSISEANVKMVLACSEQLLDKNDPCSTCLLFCNKTNIDINKHSNSSGDFQKHRLNARLNYLSWLVKSRLDSFRRLNPGYSLQTSVTQQRLMA